MRRLPTKEPPKLTTGRNHTHTRRNQGETKHTMRNQGETTHTRRNHAHKAKPAGRQVGACAVPVAVGPPCYLYIQPCPSDLLHSPGYQTSHLPSAGRHSVSQPIIPPPCPPHLTSASSHVHQTSPLSRSAHHPTSLPPAPKLYIQPCPFGLRPPCRPHSVHSTHHPTSLPPSPDHLILLGTW